MSVALTTLGENADGTVQVPSDDRQPGWFRLGPTPGEIGSAVILGHVDNTSGPGIFFYLRTLVAGDPVFVDRADGGTVEFVVDSVASYPHEQFPAQRGLRVPRVERPPTGDLRRGLRPCHRWLPVEHRGVHVTGQGHRRYAPEHLVHAASDRRVRRTDGAGQPVNVASWMWAATTSASPTGQAHDPAAPSWTPRKWTTRHEATASMGDHEVPPSVPRPPRPRGPGLRSSPSRRWRSHGRRAGAQVRRRRPWSPIRLPRRCSRCRRWSPGSPHRPMCRRQDHVHVDPGAMPAASTWDTSAAHQHRGPA